MKKYLILTFIFLSAQFTIGADVSTLIKQGDDYYSKFENRNALEYYKKAYQLAPGNYEILLKLTRAYNDVAEEFFELRKRDEGKSYVDKGLEFAKEFQNKFPDSAKAYTYLSLSYGNLSHFVGDKERIKLAKLIEENALKAIRIDQSDYLPYIILGIYYRELAALNWFERLFANTFFGSVPDGTFEDSEKMFNKALSIRSNIIVALYQLSKTYRETDRIEEEKKLLNKVLSLPNENFRDVFAKKKAKRRLEELKG